MSEQVDFPSSESSDDGLRPAASLTSIPVRRRRKSGGSDPVVTRPEKQRRPVPESTDAPVKPRKESFGKLQVPAAPAVIERPDAEPEPELRADEDAEAVATRRPAPAPEGIIALWESLAGESAIPSLIDLDLGRIATHWPNSLLLRASGSPRKPTVEVARIFSADAAHEAAALPIDTMTIDWMMALAREVTHDGVPVHELDSVSANAPDVEYGVIALPFGASPETVDHVLCHLYRYDGPSAEEEAAAAREQRERPASARAGRKMVASIFGRRQSPAN